MNKTRLYTIDNKIPVSCDKNDLKEHEILIEKEDDKYQMFIRDKEGVKKVSAGENKGSEVYINSGVNAGDYFSDGLLLGSSSIYDNDTLVYFSDKRCDILNYIYHHTTNSKDTFTHNGWMKSRRGLYYLTQVTTPITINREVVNMQTGIVDKERFNARISSAIRLMTNECFKYIQARIPNLKFNLPIVFWTRETSPIWEFEGDNLKVKLDNEELPAIQIKYYLYGSNSHMENTLFCDPYMDGLYMIDTSGNQENDISLAKVKKVIDWDFSSVRKENNLEKIEPYV